MRRGEAGGRGIVALKGAGSLRTFNISPKD
jgi:hypothetical protein